MYYINDGLTSSGGQWAECEWGLDIAAERSDRSHCQCYAVESHFHGVIAKHQWPTHGPDVNPLDYGIWGMMEGRINSRPHHSLDHLKATIQRE